MYFDKIIKTLNKHNIKYLIVGGLAINLYGIPRFTKDIDIVCDMSEDNLKRLIKAIKELGYKPRVPIKIDDFAKPELRSKWKKEKGMLAFAFFDPKDYFKELDIVMQEKLSFDKMYKNKVVMKMDKVNVYVCSIDDLIKLKKTASRKQDISDIEALNIIKRQKK